MEYRNQYSKIRKKTRKTGQDGVDRRQVSTKSGAVEEAKDLSVKTRAVQREDYTEISAEHSGGYNDVNGAVHADDHTEVNGAGHGGSYTEAVRSDRKGSRTDANGAAHTGGFTEAGRRADREDDYTKAYGEDYEDDYTEADDTDDYTEVSDTGTEEDYAEEDTADYGDGLMEEDYTEEDDYDYEETEGTGSNKKSIGDILFRIVAGFLVTAIIVTGATAVLLASGRLNGLIDKISDNQSAGTAATSMPTATPKVRVTLTPTPKLTDTPTPLPTETPVPTKSPTGESDTGVNKSTESGTAQSDTEKPAVSEVMTFHEVNDVVTAKETTNLRNVPSQGEESFIVYILQNGETVNRTGMSDEGWSRLEYNGQTVYAMSNLLTTDLTKNESTEIGTDTSGAANGELPVIKTEFTDVNEQVTPKIEVNLRLIPSVTNPAAVIVATIRNGEVVTRTGINEELGWSRVEYNGQTLYCISSYVETVTPQA